MCFRLELFVQGIFMTVYSHIGEAHTLEGEGRLGGGNTEDVVLNTVCGNN